MDESNGRVGWEGTNNGCDKGLCVSQRSGEIYRSMDGKTKEFYACVTFSQRNQIVTKEL